MIRITTDPQYEILRFSKTEVPKGLPTLAVNSACPNPSSKDDPSFDCESLSIQNNPAGRRYGANRRWNALINILNPAPLCVWSWRRANASEKRERKRVASLSGTQSTISSPQHPHYLQSLVATSFFSASHSYITDSPINGEEKIPLPSPVRFGLLSVGYIFLSSRKNCLI